jgi:hypothetical protein
MSNQPKQPTNANDHQVGGDHYAASHQHWDWVAANGLDYFQGQITKYVYRCWKKNGLEDLLKARHFLDKYIELNTPKQEQEPKQERGVVYAYRDFIFEGSKDRIDSYTCKFCGFLTLVPMDANPGKYHECAKPKGYVNQD